jgi:predicted Zn-ribbon and HTH transcriptional regulator
MSRKIKKLEQEIERLRKVNSKLRKFIKQLQSQSSSQPENLLKIQCDVCKLKGTATQDELDNDLRCPHCNSKEINKL